MSTGWGSSSAIEGECKNSVAVAIGPKSKIKASLGNFIVIPIFDDNYNIIKIISRKVDGKKIKADTWYCIKDGKLVEA